MRKVIFLIHASLDGFTAGPNGEMDWIVYNDDVAQYSHDLHAQTDTAIYGRVTYEMMYNYWPTVLANPESEEGDNPHARWLETATKIVVSSTMDSAPWENSLLIKDDIATQINALKAQPGKHMWLLGSPTLARTFIDLDLIDEYRINVNPVILGQGQPLFGELQSPVGLKLIEAQTFQGGVVALRYERG